MNPPPELDQSEKPALWNPNAAANWSLVFSPAFGAFLHKLNAQTLGRHDEAAANDKWFYGTIVYLALNLLIIFIPSFPDAPFSLVSLILLLTWYFKLGKKQTLFVKETFDKNYKKKTWGKPLLIGFGCLVGYMLLAFLFGFIVELIKGT